jgi:hypothetical protein
MAEEKDRKTKAPIKKKTVKKLEKWGSYNFKANAKAPFMLDGKIYVVSGEIAEVLIGKNYGEILD